MENNRWDTSPELLNRIWQDWNVRNSKGGRRVFETEYTYIQRKSTRAQQFEDWLYENGAWVVQRAHKRFIRFYDEDKALLFLLAYSS